MRYDLVVLFEHPEWQKPLWAALEQRGIRYAALDLKRAAFDPDSVPEAALYFNQASPSAYVRGNTRAVPLALSLMCARTERLACVPAGAEQIGTSGFAAQPEDSASALAGL